MGTGKGGDLIGNTLAIQDRLKATEQVTDVHIFAEWVMDVYVFSEWVTDVRMFSEQVTGVHVFAEQVTDVHIIFPEWVMFDEQLTCVYVC